VVPSVWRAELKKEADHFREIHAGAGVSAGEASAIVLADELDVLVDLDGYSNEGLRRSELFAVRHAPVTVAWFVYMSTLGNPFVDYVVGDLTALPPHLVDPHSENGGESGGKNSGSSVGENSESGGNSGGNSGGSNVEGGSGCTELSSAYSGKVLYLPGSFFPNSHALLFPLNQPLFGVNPTLDKSRKALGLPKRAPPSPKPPPGRHNRTQAHSVGLWYSDASFVFATFNKHLKIRSELFDVWCQALERLPLSVLWLLKYPPETEAALRLRAEGLGVLRHQLVFSEFVGTAEENWVRLWRGADAVLDTTVYGAHTGAVDALWGGLPVVTCVGHCVRQEEPSSHGDQMASRVAASMLSSLGLESELVVGSLEEYGATLFRLATDTHWYDGLRRRLEESRRELGSLWDHEAYANVFVEGLFKVWDLHLSGAPPAHVFVERSLPPPSENEGSSDYSARKRGRDKDEEESENGRPLKRRGQQSRDEQDGSTARADDLDGCGGEVGGERRHCDIHFQGTLTAAQWGVSDDPGEVFL